VEEEDHEQCQIPAGIFWLLLDADDARRPERVVGRNDLIPRKKAELKHVLDDHHSLTGKILMFHCCINIYFLQIKALIKYLAYFAVKFKHYKYLHVNAPVAHETTHTSVYVMTVIQNDLVGRGTDSSPHRNAINGSGMLSRLADDM
jgi:hypothetical protein